MIDISLDLYKIFCTVVRTGNMSAAAKELFITQPAVSMAIAQLESKLGHPLLIRAPKGITTTTEGGVLYEYLSQALHLIETAENKYLAMLNRTVGEIKIGASDTLINHFLLPYFEKYITLYPNINVKVTNRTTHETLKLLKNGSVDIGFVNLPIEHDAALDITECIEIRDVLIGGAKFAHLKKDGLHIKQIVDYPLLLLEKESNTRLYLDKFFKEYGIILNPSVDLGSSELLTKFAKINLGLAFVIKEFTIHEIDGDTLFEIPVHPPVPKRSVGLVKLKNVALSSAALGFAELVAGSSGV